jgi:hypothetical protein
MGDMPCSSNLVNGIVSFAKNMAELTWFLRNAGRLVIELAALGMSEGLVIERLPATRRRVKKIARLSQSESFRGLLCCFGEKAKGSLLSYDQVWVVYNSVQIVAARV